MTSFRELWHKALSRHPVRLAPVDTESHLARLAEEPGHPYQAALDFQGIKVHVENKRGTVRRGHGWQTRMRHHYGEIRGTRGTDGDPIDAYVGPNHDAHRVVVVHQKTPGTQNHDEDKVMLGFDSIAEALREYRAHYDRPGFYQHHTVMSVPEFKRWLERRGRDGRKIAKGDKVRGASTAISRSGASSPAKWLSSKGYIRGKRLDYGSGRGQDAAKYGMSAYDPAHAPKKPEGKYNTITCTYVLNVVSAGTQSKILADIRRLLAPGGSAFISVRRDVAQGGQEGRGTRQRYVRLRLPELKGTPSGFATYVMGKNPQAGQKVEELADKGFTALWELVKARAPAPGQLSLFDQPAPARARATAPGTAVVQPKPKPAEPKAEAPATAQLQVPIVEGKTKKKGRPIFIAQERERLGKEAWTARRDQAKEAGGWWSGQHKGWAFRSSEAARSFAAERMGAAPTTAQLQPVAAKPKAPQKRPPGKRWQPIPKGKRGGFRRRKGKGWDYWYPDAPKWTAHQRQGRDKPTRWSLAGGNLQITDTRARGSEDRFVVHQKMPRLEGGVERGVQWEEASAHRSLADARAAADKYAPKHAEAVAGARRVAKVEEEARRERMAPEKAPEVTPQVAGKTLPPGWKDGGQPSARGWWHTGEGTHKFYNHKTGGLVFLVRDGERGGWGMAATGKKRGEKIEVRGVSLQEAEEAALSVMEGRPKLEKKAEPPSWLTPQLHVGLVNIQAGKDPGPHVTAELRRKGLVDVKQGKLVLHPQGVEALALGPADPWARVRGPVSVQHVGDLPGVAAKDLQAGDVLAYSYGHKRTLIKPPERRGKFLVLTERHQDGTERTFKKKADTLVAIDIKEGWDAPADRPDAPTIPKPKPPKQRPLAGHEGWFHHPDGGVHTHLVDGTELRVWKRWKGAGGWSSERHNAEHGWIHDSMFRGDTREEVLKLNKEYAEKLNKRHVARAGRSEEQMKADEHLVSELEHSTRRFASMLPQPSGAEVAKMTQRQLRRFKLGTPADRAMFDEITKHQRVLTSGDGDHDEARKRLGELSKKVIERAHEASGSNVKPKLPKGKPLAKHKAPADPMKAVDALVAKWRSGYRGKLTHRTLSAKPNGRVGVFKLEGDVSGGRWGVVELRARGDVETHYHDRKKDAVAHAEDIYEAQTNPHHTDEHRKLGAAVMEVSQLPMPTGPFASDTPKQLRELATLLLEGRAPGNVYAGKYANRTWGRERKESKAYLAHLAKEAKQAALAAVARVHGKHKAFELEPAMRQADRLMRPGESLRSVFDAGYKVVEGKGETYKYGTNLHPDTTKALHGAGLRLVPHGLFPVHPQPFREKDTKAAGFVELWAKARTKPKPRGPARVEPSPRPAPGRPPGSGLRKAIKPPGGGWQAIPGGKHGGFRKPKGGGWEYWYPDTMAAKQSARHHAKQARKTRRQIMRNLGRHSTEELIAQLDAHEEHAKQAHQAKSTAERMKATKKAAKVQQKLAKVLKRAGASDEEIESVLRAHAQHSGQSGEKPKEEAPTEEAPAEEPKGKPEPKTFPELVAAAMSTPKVQQAIETAVREAQGKQPEKEKPGPPIGPEPPPTVDPSKREELERTVERLRAKHKKQKLSAKEGAKLQRSEHELGLLNQAEKERKDVDVRPKRKGKPMVVTRAMDAHRGYLERQLEASKKLPTDKRNASLESRLQMDIERLKRGDDGPIREHQERVGTVTRLMEQMARTQDPEAAKKLAPQLAAAAKQYEQQHTVPGVKAEAEAVVAGAKAAAGDEAERQAAAKRHGVRPDQLTLTGDLGYVPMPGAKREKPAAEDPKRAEEAKRWGVHPSKMVQTKRGWQPEWHAFQRKSFTGLWSLVKARGRKPAPGQLGLFDQPPAPPPTGRAVPGPWQPIPKGKRGGRKRLLPSGDWQYDYDKPGARKRKRTPPKGKREWQPETDDPADPAWAPNFHDYDVLVVNTSAGKDSQAMLDRVAKLADEQGYPRNKIHAVHADLGRVEWEGVRELAERQAKHYGMPFHVVKRPQGDVIDQVQERYDLLSQRKADTELLRANGIETWQKLLDAGPITVAGMIGDATDPATAKRAAKLVGYAKTYKVDKGKGGEEFDVSVVPWPGTGPARYCTSDHKREQVKTWTSEVVERIQVAAGSPTRGKKAQKVRVLNMMGIRGEESAAREKKPPFEAAHKKDKRSTISRRVDSWHPIHHHSEEDVWNAIRESGVEHHPAYDLGMKRLSCVFCFFQSPEDMALAGKNNPKLLDEMIAREKQYGSTFKQGWGFKDVKKAIGKMQWARRPGGMVMVGGQEELEKLGKAVAYQVGRMLAQAVDVMRKAGKPCKAIVWDWKSTGACLHVEDAEHSHHVAWVPYPAARPTSIAALHSADKLGLRFAEHGEAPPVLEGVRKGAQVCADVLTFEALGDLLRKARKPAPGQLAFNLAPAKPKPAAKPGPWQPIPKGKRGGRRRRKASGKGYEYDYDKPKAQEPKRRQTQAEHVAAVQLGDDAVAKLQRAGYRLQFGRQRPMPLDMSLEVERIVGGGQKGRYLNAMGIAVIPTPERLAEHREKRELEPAGVMRLYPEQVGPMHANMDLGELEEAIRHEKREHLAVFGTEGHQLARLRGSKTTVQFDEEALFAALEDGNAVITHNHPQSSPLSPDDILSAVGVNAAQIRAVQAEGTWVLTRPPGGWATNALVLKRALGDAKKLAKNDATEAIARHAVDVAGKDARSYVEGNDELLGKYEEEFHKAWIKYAGRRCKELLGVDQVWHPRHGLSPS